MANENYEIILNADLSLTMVQVSCEVPTSSFCIGGKCDREEPLGVSALDFGHCTSPANCPFGCSSGCDPCTWHCEENICKAICKPKPPTNV